ncbi:hypothetical protein ACFW04_011696 [Cataglyphis niger]
MRSPLFSIIADIVLQNIEEKALSTLMCVSFFYVKCVDDMAMSFSIFSKNLVYQEIAENNGFNFLEVSILLQNNRLSFDWYHKTIFSDRHLNFFSQLCEKRGTIISLIDRTFLLIFIFRHSISDAFKNIIKDVNVKLSFCSLNKLSRNITMHKDRFSNTSVNNVVYKINCICCNPSYVGQTSRKLQTRTKKYRNHRFSSLIGLLSSITD